MFVHGAPVRDADWWWHRMPGPLARHGLRTAAVEHEQALTRKARQDAAALTGPVTVPAWLSVPSTYVVCGEDRAIPADRQRAAAVRAGRTVEIPTGHHPFLSRPDLFAETLAGTIRTGVTFSP
jgi:pimeloyl-ACP methyl ester carboxylesterase